MQTDPCLPPMYGVTAQVQMNYQYEKGKATINTDKLSLLFYEAFVLFYRGCSLLAWPKKIRKKVEYMYFCMCQIIIQCK